MWLAGLRYRAHTPGVRARTDVGHAGHQEDTEVMPTVSVCVPMRVRARLSFSFNLRRSDCTRRVHRRAAVRLRST